LSIVAHNLAMRNAGHIGQDNKVLVGKTLEFLRISYNGDGTLRGYLCRSIPNLVITDY